MLRGVGDVVQLLANFLPGWAVAVIVGVVMVIALPAWIRSGKSKKIRGDIRRMVRAEGERLTELHQAILGRAGDDMHLLEFIVKEARRREQHRLVADAMERLQGLPGSLEFIRRLDAEPPPTPNDRRWGHPIEAAAAIQTLIDNGAHAAAEARLDEVLRRFPDDEELAALQGRLAAARDAARSG